MQKHGSVWGLPSPHACAGDIPTCTTAFAAPHHQYSIPRQTPQADFVQKCLLIPAAGHRAGYYKPAWCFASGQ